MIECGYCGAATERAKCSNCGREPALPWLQRAMEPPRISERELGRPPLDPVKVRHTLRLAIKDNPGATNAQLADALSISERTLSRWQRLING